MSTWGLRGRRAMVTGAASGIGAEVARSLWREHVHVSLIDVDEQGLTRLAGELGGSSVPVHTSIADVADEEAVARAVASTLGALGGLDIVVNSAGIQPLSSLVPVEELPEELFDRIVAVNLRGAFLVMRAAVPHLRRAGQGVVVNVASVQGLQAMPRASAYCASKSGLLGLTKSSALDYAAEGIRVVSVCPGSIDTGMLRASARAEGGHEDANVERYGRVHPIGRIGRAEDVAAAILFLVSDHASFITGENLCVDGGLMAQGSWASGAGADARRSSSTRPSKE